MKDTIKMKVAIFEYTDLGGLSCLAGMQVATSTNRNDPDTKRVSEWQEVEFTKIDEGPANIEILRLIDKNIEQAIKNLADLKEKRSKVER